MKEKLRKKTAGEVDEKPDRNDDKNWNVWRMKENKKETPVKKNENKTECTESVPQKITVHLKPSTIKPTARQTDRNPNLDPPPTQVPTVEKIPTTQPTQPEEINQLVHPVRKEEKLAPIFKNMQRKPNMTKNPAEKLKPTIQDSQTSQPTPPTNSNQEVKSRLAPIFTKIPKKTTKAPQVAKETPQNPENVTNNGLETEKKEEKTEKIKKPKSINKNLRTKNDKNQDKKKIDDKRQIEKRKKYWNDLKVKNLVA